MKLARRERQSALSPFRRGGSSPFSELSRIRNQINQLFEDPFSLTAPPTGFFEGWSPTVDIYEDKDKITVTAELPGMKKENIDVSLHGNALTVSGERKEEEEERREGENYRSERYFGRFQRTITLPTPVDPNKIQASYRDGVLTITCPKSEEAKPKQIQVKTS